MKRIKKFLAIVLSITMVMCSTLPSLASENNAVQETTESIIVEQLKEDLGEEKVEEILEFEETSEIEEEPEEDLVEEEEKEEGTESEEETERVEETESEEETEIVEETEGEEETESVEETDKVEETENEAESEKVEETESIEETGKEEETVNVAETEKVEEAEKTESDTANKDDESLLGVTYWCYWYIDETDPENITIHYSSTEPANYDSYGSGKKGRESSTSSSPRPGTAATRQSIKTAVFDDEIIALTCNAWFSGFSSLTTITNLSNLNASNVTSMENMFKSCSSLTSIDFPAINAQNVTNLKYMFDSCTSLTSINLSNVTFDKVSDASYMFNGCSLLTTVNISSIFSNSVTNINASRLFQNCTSLTAFYGNSINLSNVSNMSYMFDGCAALETLDFSAVSAAAVTTVSYMLRNCNALLSIKLSDGFASRINNSGLKGNWKKTTAEAVYEYTTKTTIPAEAGEYERVFKITFEGNGGNAIAPVFKTHNSTLDLPSAVRPGFTFVAWYNESELTNQLTSPITITEDKTVYAKWDGDEGAQLVYWGIGKSRNTSTGKVRTLYIAARELSVNIYSTEYKGSFANTAEFNSEDEVPWHPFRSEINTIVCSTSESYSVKFKSMAYWFKDMTRLTSTNVAQSLTRYNDILETVAHAFEGCTNLKHMAIYVSNSLKSMDSAFKNCNSLKYLNTLKPAGVSNADVNIQLESNGIKDTFNGCTSLRRINLRNFDFSSYTGDVFSCAELPNFIRIRTKDSGNLFNRIGLTGEWWEYDSGNKYSSGSIPNNARQIRKYETFANTVYWYLQGDELHLLSSRPSNSNYKDGHYFNGDESNVYGMLPLDVPDNSKIVFDSNISLRYTAGSSFFGNLTDAQEIVNINRLNTSAVTDMTSMFSGMQITSVDLSTFDTSNATIMNSMFYGCENLTTLNLSNFNTQNVTDMSYMFTDCSSLQSINFSNFNTSKVETMSSMFENCSSIATIDISTFSSESLEDDGDGHNYNSIDCMFHDCSSLTTIYVSDSFDITYDSSYSYTSTYDVFTGCTQLVGGNGTVFDSDHTNAEYARIDVEGTPGYFTRGDGSAPTPAHVLNNITINHAPTKVKYKVGESFDPTGLILNLNFSDSTTETVAYNNSTSSGFSFDPTLYDTFAAAGNPVQISITYSGKTCTQDVEVIEPQSIAVKTSPNKLKYVVGEAFDPTGLALELTYSDTTTKETIPYEGNELNISFDPNGWLTNTDNQITITYHVGGNDFDCTLDIEVMELTSIIVKTPPTTLKYAIGSTFDPAGLSIDLLYSDNTTRETVTYAGNETRFSFNPSIHTQLNTSGNAIPITITYGGKSCTQNIQVVELSSIEINNSPTKVVYNVGERFDPTGLKIKLIYSDSTDQIVAYSSSNSSSFSFTPSIYSGLTTANTSISIGYAGKSCSQDITIKELTSVTIYSNPTRLNYATGQSLNPNGLVLTLNWTTYTVSGTTTDSNNVTYNSTTQSKFAFSPSGTLASSGNITVTYDGKTGANLQPTFTVTVRTVASISVISSPNKTSYSVGNKLAPAGLSIKVNYEDGTEDVVSYSAETSGDFTFTPSATISLNTSNSSVTVTYGGKSTTFGISVTQVNNNNNHGSTTTSHRSDSGSSSSSGGTGVAPAGFNPPNNNYTPTTTQVSVSKSISGVMSSSTSSWAVDPSTGKWKLNAVDVNGNAVSATNGFYMLTNTVTRMVNNILVQVEVNNTYYFDDQGNMVTGWVKTSDNKWFFFENAKTADEGRMTLGWKVVGGSWYYFTADGSMLENGVTPDGYTIGTGGKWVG